MLQFRWDKIPVFFVSHIMNGTKRTKKGYKLRPEQQRPIPHQVTSYISYTSSTKNKGQVGKTSSWKLIILTKLSCNISPSATQTF